MVVDFVKRMEMAVVNTYLKKKEKCKVTWEWSKVHTSRLYLMQKVQSERMTDCKVVAGES